MADPVYENAAPVRDASTQDPLEHVRIGRKTFLLVPEANLEIADYKQWTETETHTQTSSGGTTIVGGYGLSRTPTTQTTTTNKHFGKIWFKPEDPSAKEWSHTIAFGEDTPDLDLRIGQKAIVVHAVNEKNDKNYPSVLYNLSTGKSLFIGDTRKMGAYFLPKIMPVLLTALFVAFMYKTNNDKFDIFMMFFAAIAFLVMWGLYSGVYVGTRNSKLKKAAMRLLQERNLI